MMNSIAQQYEEVLKQLSDIEHYKKTPTRNYGIHNPEDVPISDCVCGLKPVVVATQVEGKKNKFTIKCDCGNQGLGGYALSLEALNWNKGRYAQKVPYQHLALFGLKSLTPEEAVNKLTPIVQDLELRIKEANLRSKLGIERGKKYFLRLKLYKLWAEWALSSIDKSDRQAVRLIEDEEDEEGGEE